MSPLLLPALLGLAAGLAAGVWHFVSLDWNLRLWLAGRGALALGVQLLRLALIAALLVGLARLGAAAVLAAATGLLLARQAVMHHRRRKEEA